MADVILFNKSVTALAFDTCVCCTKPSETCNAVLAVASADRTVAVLSISSLCTSCPRRDVNDCVATCVSNHLDWLTRSYLLVVEEYREDGCHMTGESATLYTVQGHEKEVCPKCRAVAHPT